jgi:hypothetical protein
LKPANAYVLHGDGEIVHAQPRRYFVDFSVRRVALSAEDGHVIELRKIATFGLSTSAISPLERAMLMFGRSG